MLFIGTFVPLQGVDVIARAMLLLRARSDISFRFIGNGQSAAQVQALLAAEGYTALAWETGWQSAQQLAAAIAEADICLGIFGAGDKAQRVWPFKNYSYMAVGRALITARTRAEAALGEQAEGAPPWTSVPAERPDLLAQAIAELADDPATRVRQARAAAAFYRAHLANAVSLAALRRSLGARTGPG